MTTRAATPENLNRPGSVQCTKCRYVFDAGVDDSGLCEGCRITCECGEWDGHFACQWSGPIEETTIAEFMPEQYRASHAEARNHGSYPHNGARRIRVNLECAKRMQEHDGIWVEILSDEVPRDANGLPVDRQIRRHLAAFDV